MKLSSIFFATALVFIPIVASPCEAIGRDGTAVRVDSETAIIVWNAKNHVEDFIRTAKFETAGRDLGFLVPTPTPPKLSEVKQTAFDQLSADVTRHQPQPVVAAGAKAAAKADDPVVSVSHVGGYQATVLSTKNPQAIDNWLRRHGFPKSEATTKWLAPYIERRWAITAFRVVSAGDRAGLNPVRMTFHTDRAFYPYREPKTTAQSRGQRTLRVFYLADQHPEANMGAKPWVANEEMSDQLTAAETAELSRSLPGVMLPKTPCLTTFLDTSSPRIGADEVYFSPTHPYQYPYLFLWIAAAITGIAGAFLFLQNRHLNSAGSKKR